MSDDKSKLKPEDIRILKEVAAQFNEVARRIMAASMSSRCMTYDMNAISLVKGEFDYNGQQLHLMLRDVDEELEKRVRYLRWQTNDRSNSINNYRDMLHRTFEVRDALFEDKKELLKLIDYVQEALKPFSGSSYEGIQKSLAIIAAYKWKKK